MARISSRAIRVLAVLEDYRGGGTGDVLDAILPFFEPVIAEFAGTIFDPEQCAIRIRAEYRWNITRDVIEELIPRFVAKGWLESVGSAGDTQLYKGTYSGTSSVPASTEARATETLSKLVEQFRSFISELAPLTAVSLTDEALADGLVEWLVTEDAYSVEVLREQVASQLDGGKNKSLEPAPAESSALLSSEMRYLCARFIKHLFAEKSELIPDLCKLASIGLLTEVIRDFNAPTTRVNRTDLIVYVDAPVALDLLGVSGKSAADNIRALVSQLQGIGAHIRIFGNSVEELTNALKAVLRQGGSQRFGATADALRRNETSEVFVKQVVNAPEPLLKQFSVTIDDRKLNQFPNAHQYFPAELYDELFSKITWHPSIRPREHDTTAITQIVRMRGGASSSDLFSSKFVFVTRNGLLAQSSRRFCIQASVAPSRSVGPAIHQRQLATAVWLRTGLQVANDDIPRRYLLASCERVLELKPSVVNQVRLFARNLTPEKEQQLELLLTQDRSTQVLMDKTLGASGVVGPQNIELLVDEMKKAFTAEIERTKVEEIKKVEGLAASKVLSADNARTEAESRARRAEEAMAAAHREEVQLVNRLLTEVNSFLVRARWFVYCGAGAVLLTLAFGPIVAELGGHGLAKFAPLVLVAIFTFWLVRLQLSDRPTGLPRLLEYFGNRRLAKLATKRGLAYKIDRMEVGFSDNEFSIYDSRPPQISTDRPDLLSRLPKPDG